MNANTPQPYAQIQNTLNSNLPIKNSTLPNNRAQSNINQGHIDNSKPQIQKAYSTGNVIDKKQQFAPPQNGVFLVNAVNVPHNNLNILNSTKTNIPSPLNQLAAAASNQPKFQAYQNAVGSANVHSTSNHNPKFIAAPQNYLPQQQQNYQQHQNNNATSPLLLNNAVTTNQGNFKHQQTNQNQPLPAQYQQNKSSFKQTIPAYQKQQNESILKQTTPAHQKTARDLKINLPNQSSYLTSNHSDKITPNRSAPVNYNNSPLMRGSDDMNGGPKRPLNGGALPAEKKARDGMDIPGFT